MRGLVDIDIGADTLNAHYAAISTDPAYIPPPPPVKMSCESRLISVTESTVFKELQNLVQTAAWPDGLPSWCLKLAAPFFSVPIAHLLNVFLQQG